jgi:GAF domain-containing protein
VSSPDHCDLSLVGCYPSTRAPIRRTSSGICISITLSISTSAGLRRPQCALMMAGTSLAVHVGYDIQYGIGQGPCITAAREGQTVMSGSLGSDPRWRKFGGTVARLGVHSVLSLPLVTPDRVVGAMNVYAHDRHVFDERAAELGEIYAVPAAIAVQNAQVLAQTQRLAAQLQSALETRGVIDRAIGIMMSRSGGTEDQALARLRALSQNEHHKLAVIARQIIDDAVRRAQARRDSG